MQASSLVTNFKNNIADLNSKVNRIAGFFEIKNRYLKKILPTFLFLIFLHFFYCYIGIYKYIDKRPCSIHSSAQCQRASVALNYYENDMNFFKPMVQKDSVGVGITGLEFPFVNYSVAILYKLFGFNEAYYRGFVLATLLIGLYLHH